MSTETDTELQNAYESGRFTSIALVKAEFDSGDVRFWTGVGEIQYNGETYVGAGNLLSLSCPNENRDLTAGNFDVQLSGINASMLSIALSETSYNGRPITIWLGCLYQFDSFDLLTEDGQSLLTEDGDNLILEQAEVGIIGEPVRLFQGYMDVMTINDDGETATINMRSESKTVLLTNTQERRYTSKDQQLDYPDDNFFDQVPSLQNLEIIWGRDA